MFWAPRSSRINKLNNEWVLIIDSRLHWQAIRIQYGFNRSSTWLLFQKKNIWKENSRNANMFIAVLLISVASSK